MQSELERGQNSKSGSLRMDSAQCILCFFILNYLAKNVHAQDQILIYFN